MSSSRFVLDTSMFVNPETRRVFGADVPGAVSRFLSLTRKHRLELYMPVSIFRELSHFCPSETLTAVRREATVRAPDIHNLQVPAAILHTFIGDLRERINKGLRVAEKALRNTDVSDNVRWLRENYRAALRTGIVDSVEDFHVVLLAKEVMGNILSADRGIARMAEDLGIEVFSAEEFIDRYPEDQ